MDKILVILGPTATGKTDIALSLAKELNGELISADSRQVYKKLDIGTGKLPGKEVSIKKGTGFWEMDGVKVWVYDIVDPQVQFTVYDYIENANKAINDIQRRGKLPIIVGGTGFYIKGLLEGFSNLDIPVDEKLRGELQGLSLEQLQGRLQALSPAKWESLNNSDKNNKRRLLRFIEIIFMYPYIRTNQKTENKNKISNVLKIGLTAPRPVLNERIDSRLVSRINQGMIEEGERLLKGDLTLNRMKELGLEYGLLADLLSGKLDKGKFISTLKTKIHQYAKRQITWFRREKGIEWLDITDPLYHEKVEKIAFSWYYQTDNKKNKCFV